MTWCRRTTKRFVSAISAVASMLVVSLATTAVARNPRDEIPMGETATDYGEYPLDHLSRRITPGARVRCPEIERERYAGTTIRFARPVSLARAFIPHVRALEELVTDAAIAVYGRAPAKLIHAGAYNCRAVRLYPDLLSEHGLGNALDVRGFDFDRATEPNSVLPRTLSGSFSVRVLDHWQSTRTRVGSIHAEFFRELGRRLESRPTLFRGMLGPRFPGHRDHLHFDMAPWALIYM